jgi:uncharacterized protein YjiS (DUF1127 family)
MFVINLLTAAREAFAEWRRRDRAYGELMALGDRELADIGVNRSEIPALVYGSNKTREEPSPVTDFALGQARLAGGHRWLPPL